MLCIYSDHSPGCTVSYNQDCTTLNKFAAMSVQKAGHFKSEIVPITVDGKQVKIDDGIHSGIDHEVMLKFTCKCCC